MQYPPINRKQYSPIRIALSYEQKRKVKAGKWDVPLPKVDYQEKQFAQGVISSTYVRREGAPKERELLCGRLIDWPIRPLFPAVFYHEVQVMASVLYSDGK